MHRQRACMARGLPVQPVAARGWCVGTVCVCAASVGLHGSTRSAAAAILNFNKVAASSETDSGTVLSATPPACLRSLLCLCFHTVFSRYRLQNCRLSQNNRCLVCVCWSSCFVIVSSWYLSSMQSSCCSMHTAVCYSDLHFAFNASTFALSSMRKPRRGTREELEVITVVIDGIATQYA